MRYHPSSYPGYPGVLILYGKDRAPHPIERISIPGAEPAEFAPRIVNQSGSGVENRPRQSRIRHRLDLPDPRESSATLCCSCVTALSHQRSSIVIFAEHLTGHRFQLSGHALQVSCNTPVLSITFGSIMSNAEHLAILDRTSSALAPCRNMVRIHFGELPYFALMSSMANCAERAI